MRSAKAIFTKQVKDMFRNPAVLAEFVIFPLVAFVMTQLVAKQNPAIPENIFVTMMASIFAGMALITTTAAVIAEDIERKSLRFLIMAGVKPLQYLLGTVGFTLAAGIVVSVLFALIGSFTAAELMKFLAVMAAGVAASALLGATIGILSKNQQAATAVALPTALVLGFTPMISMFNETVENFAGILYTQQLNVVVNDFSQNFPKAMLVIAANIAVFALLFAAVYKKKGLRI